MEISKVWSDQSTLYRGGDREQDMQLVFSRDQRPFLIETWNTIGKELTLLDAQW